MVTTGSALLLSSSRIVLLSCLLPPSQDQPVSSTNPLHRASDSAALYKFFFMWPRATPGEQGHSFSSPSPLNQGQNPSVLSYALPDVLNVFDEIAARQLIFNFPEELIADAGILALMEHADFEGIEQLALVICSEIASTFDNLKYVKPGPV